MSKWRTVATGAAYSLALRSDSTLWGWGGWIRPFVTDSINNTVNVPTQLTAGKWLRIVAGSDFALAQHSDSTWWIWGNTGPITLIDIPKGQVDFPVSVPGSWLSFSAGTQAGVGLRPDSTLWIWGTGPGTENQGNAVDVLRPLMLQQSDVTRVLKLPLDFAPTTIDLTTYVQVPPGNQVVSWALTTAPTSNDKAHRVFATLQGSRLTLESAPDEGGEDVIAIDVKGLDGNTVSFPVRILVGNSTDLAPHFISISALTTNASAIAVDSSLWSWGTTWYGALGVSGVGYNNRQTSPYKIDSLHKWASVVSRNQGGFALQADGSLWGWGENAGGHLGNGNSVNQYSPVRIGTSLWRSLSADVGHVMGIQRDSSLWAWGGNDSSQLGDSLTSFVYIPKRIGTAKWLQVDAGYQFSVGIQSDSTLWTWGSNNSGQLGDGTTVRSRVPHQVGTGKWLKVSAGYGHVVAMMSDSTLWTWGSNFYGQLGDSTYNNNRKVPHRVNADKWRTMSSSYNHVVAIRNDGTLWSWGLDFGTSWAVINGNDGHFPFQIGTDTWKTVVTGQYYALALRSDSTLWSWGSAQDGQCGCGYDYSSGSFRRSFDRTETPAILKALPDTSLLMDFPPDTIDLTKYLSGIGQLQFRVVSTGHALTVQSSQGLLILKPIAGAWGMDTVYVVGTQYPRGDQVMRFKVQVRGNNHAPVITSTLPQVAKMDSILTLTLAMVQASDIDGDPLTLVPSTGPHYSLTGLVLRPDPGYVGDLLVPVHVSDGALSSYTLTLFVTVSDASPVAVKGPSLRPAPKAWTAPGAGKLVYFDAQGRELGHCNVKAGDAMPKQAFSHRVARVKFLQE